MNHSFTFRAVTLKSVVVGALAYGTAALALTGCMRGGTSELPPVHIVQDMDFQAKVKTQSKAAFAAWSDHRGMRLPVTDANGRTAVVARGSLPNPALTHRDASGAFVTVNPLAVSEAVLQRGRERFDIFCSVCHGYSGQGGNGPQGNGLVGRRWPVVIPNFHFVEGNDNRVPLMPIGEYFETITTGKGTTMPAYGARISPKDRWSILHYVRVLQSLSK